MNYDSEDERLLDRFGQWMREARAAAEAIDVNGRPPPETPALEPAGGLYRTVEEVTALRHELKLQTKSSRNLEEQTQALQQSLAQAIEALRSIEPKESQAAWAQGKALALALAELDEALERGRAQTEKAAARLLAEPRDDVLAKLADFHQRQSAIERLVCERYYRKLR
ncbi:MAG TPA: hypothetical protein VGX78_11840 [Pirellulales bacterium]|nr:hypothetical protein [Pirellulales bacterium]